MEVFGSFTSEEEYLTGAKDLEESEEAYLQLVIDQVPEYIERHEEQRLKAELEEECARELIWDYELEFSESRGERF